jgi:large subunit ribosomal protein L1
VGKKRIKLIGSEEAKKKKGRRKPKKEVLKSGKQQGRLTDMGQIALEEAEKIKKKSAKLEEETAKETLEVAQEKIKKQKRKTRSRGSRYLTARKLVDRAKLYPLKEAVSLVKKTSLSRFPGSVELHLITQKEGLSGEISFPHPTGKTAKIAIASDALLAKIKKGKTDFDVLLASPEMMPKLAPLAKILGPKGLMPNPKRGTIDENPKKLAKKLSGKTRYKAEKKAPLIHLVVGKTDQPEKELVENVETAFQAIGKTNLQKAVLAPTMGPGIKISLE